jgi:hypothetical protein
VKLVTNIIIKMSTETRKMSADNRPPLFRDSSKPKVAHRRPKLSKAQREQNRRKAKELFDSLTLERNGVIMSDREFEEYLAQCLTDRFSTKSNRANGIGAELSRQWNPFLDRFASIEEMWDVPPELFQLVYLLPYISSRDNLNITLHKLCGDAWPPPIPKVTDIFWQYAKEDWRTLLIRWFPKIPMKFGSAEVNVEAFMLDEPNVQLLYHPTDTNQSLYFQDVFLWFNAQPTPQDATIPFTFDDKFDHSVILWSQSLSESISFMKTFKEAVMQRRRLIVYLIDELIFEPNVFAGTFNELGNQKLLELINEFGDEAAEKGSETGYFSIQFFPLQMIFVMYPVLSMLSSSEVTEFRRDMARYVEFIPGRRLDFEKCEFPHNGVHLLYEVKKNPDFEEVATKMCNNCLQKFDHSLEVCGGCKQVRYCSRECQRQDWKNRHKAVCQSS